MFCFARLFLSSFYLLWILFVYVFLILSEDDTLLISRSIMSVRCTISFIELVPDFHAFFRFFNSRASFQYHLLLRWIVKRVVISRVSLLGKVVLVGKGQALEVESHVWAQFCLGREPQISWILSLELSAIIYLLIDAINLFKFTFDMYQWGRFLT